MGGNKKTEPSVKVDVLCQDGAAREFDFGMEDFGSVPLEVIEMVVLCVRTSTLKAGLVGASSHVKSRFLGAMQLGRSKEVESAIAQGQSLFDNDDFVLAREELLMSMVWCARDGLSRKLGKSKWALRVWGEWSRKAQDEAEVKAAELAREQKQRQPHAGAGGGYQGRNDRSVQGSSSGGQGLPNRSYAKRLKS